MVLSPIEIHDKEFEHKFRGYNRDQVDKFLKQVAQDYDLALQKNEQIQKELEDTKEQLKYFTDMRDALNQSIIVAQDAADKVKTNAEQEAQVIVEESQKKARDLLDQSTAKSNQILEDASSKARQVTIETNDLKKKSADYRRGLQEILRQQLNMIQSPEWEKLSDETSTDDLKQRVGMQTDFDQTNNQTQNVDQSANMNQTNNPEPDNFDQNNGAQQGDNYENDQTDYENSSDTIPNEEQMNYNNNIPDEKPADPYTVSHEQNAPTFNFTDDEADSAETDDNGEANN
ncbi:DivIVA domain-containing protein [Companilactobacillus nodensis]|uniref:Cell-division initiation protein (Septum placement) n=1 Tax=Companilactobacillus nodensis DSM 19682 = JCM 14932 = NBRC 107160 TaxID=1423775 RepID=A0A0R1KBE6_9LACO|nr:DivIVA domain-containing protein [Companilactobacillus nodensis]KRK80699.1 cell-division initiation protein (septum placement) [Companilactobacillus nodensis DSM 19682 = JCM 14932 = NBRC 107160]